MGWLWLIISIVIFAISMYALGRWDNNHDDKVGFIPAIAALSAVWPFLLAIVIVIGPFLGLFFLGEYVREKKNEKR